VQGPLRHVMGGGHRAVAEIGIGYVGPDAG
jgi:hypothetical protein